MFYSRRYPLLFVLAFSVALGIGILILNIFFGLNDELIASKTRKYSVNTLYIIEIVYCIFGIAIAFLALYAAKEYENRNSIDKIEMYRRLWSGDITYIRQSVHKAFGKAAFSNLDNFDDYEKFETFFNKKKICVPGRDKQIFLSDINDLINEYNHFCKMIQCDVIDLSYVSDTGKLNFVKYYNLLESYILFRRRLSNSESYAREWTEYVCEATKPALTF